MATKKTTPVKKEVETPKKIEEKVEEPKKEKKDINEEVRFLQGVISRYEKILKKYPNLQNTRTVQFLKYAHREQEVLASMRRT